MVLMETEEGNRQGADETGTARAGIRWPPAWKMKTTMMTRIGTKRES
jgi:hypothetical protein